MYTYMYIFVYYTYIQVIAISKYSAVGEEAIIDVPLEFKEIKSTSVCVSYNQYIIILYRYVHENHTNSNGMFIMYIHRLGEITC